MENFGNGSGSSVEKPRGQVAESEKKSLSTDEEDEWESLTILQGIKNRKGEELSPVLQERIEELKKKAGNGGSNENKADQASDNPDSPQESKNAPENLKKTEENESERESNLETKIFQAPVQEETAFKAKTQRLIKNDEEKVSQELEELRKKHGLGIPEKETGSSNFEVSPEVLTKYGEPLVRALMDKRSEYQKRFQEATSNLMKGGNNDESVKDSLYKRDLLDNFFKTGEVNPEAIRANKAGVDEKTLNNAFLVIKGYVENQGRGVRGGTGLRMKSEQTTLEVPEISREQSIEESIKSIKNEEQLMGFLRVIPGIQGSSEFYSSGDLFDYVSLAFSKQTDKAIQDVTRSLGLRDKVEELIKKQKKEESGNFVEKKSGEREEPFNEEEMQEELGKMTSPNQIISYLKSIEGLPGSERRFYPSSELVYRVSQAFNLKNEKSIVNIPRAGGLRHHVVRIMNQNS